MDKFYALSLHIGSSVHFWKMEKIVVNIYTRAYLTSSAQMIIVIIGT